MAMGMWMGSCSSDEPAPVPAPPVYPEHPEKNWKGERAHGFITDVTAIRIPRSDRGFLPTGGMEGNDEIVIDRDLTPIDWNDISDAPSTRGTETQYLNTFSYLHFDGTVADPFENFETYVALCHKYNFRWKSQFSEVEELLDLRIPARIMVLEDGYMLTEKVKGFDIITEKYFDKNHPAGSSMRLIDKVGMSIMICGLDYRDLSFGLYSKHAPLILPVGVVGDEGRNVEDGIQIALFGFPEKAGEYPMILRVTMEGDKQVRDEKFVIKFVDKK